MVAQLIFHSLRLVILFLLMVFEMFFLAESAPRKVKSLHALFALATEVLRLFGDFADQVGRESG